MKILLLSKYTRLGASSRVRSYQYLTYLKDRGLNITVSEFFSDEYLLALYKSGSHKIFIILKAYLRRLLTLFKAGSYDLLWIEKELFPWLPAWTEQLLKLLGIRYIVDYDDAIFHKYDINKNRFIRWVLGSKIDTVMALSNCVFVGNDYLGERAKSAGAPSVVKVPTVVNTDVYEVKRLHQDKLVIGWIGTPITVKYLHIVSNALTELNREIPFSLRLIGSGDFDIGDVDVQTVEWNEQTEVDEIQKFDIGIMPLPNEPWERGKCGYKLIQYMACGKVVVASPVGENARIVDHGTDGFLATSTKEWIDALRFLMKDKESRENMGNKARIKVEQQYSLSVSAPLLYKEIIKFDKGL